MRDTFFEGGKLPREKNKKTKKATWCQRNVKSQQPTGQRMWGKRKNPETSFTHEGKGFP